MIVDARKSHDTDGNIMTYTWNWGDGSVGSGIRAKHNYDAPGKYKIGLTVKDNSGLSSTSFIYVDVFDTISRV